MIKNLLIDDNKITFVPEATGDYVIILITDHPMKRIVCAEKFFAEGSSTCELRTAGLLGNYALHIVNCSGAYSRLVNKNEKLEVLCQNDANVKVYIPEYHRYSSSWAARLNLEVFFRRITAELFKSGLIQKNTIDLGAWLGDNTLPWSMLTNGKIYAIDPSEDNISYIKKLIHLNSRSNIVAIQEAICDRDQMISTNQDLHHAEFTLGTSGAIKIEAKSLDSLMRTGDIRDVDFIHLDVEGMEYLVIKGARNLIDAYRPIIAYEQHLNKDDVNGIVSYLGEMDYESFMINEVIPGCLPDCRNFFAIPVERADVFEQVWFKNYVETDVLVRQLPAGLGVN